MSALKIYLRNHDAAAQAGRDLFSRAAHTQRTRPWSEHLDVLSADVQDDVTSLRRLMRAAGVSPDHLAGLAMRAGERVARLKPNGHLIFRAPLSDLIEVEGLLDAVRAKQAGWYALAAASVLPVSAEPLLDDLAHRADEQIDTLLIVHALAARASLSSKEHSRRPSSGRAV